MNEEFDYATKRHETVIRIDILNSAYLDHDEISSHENRTEQNRTEHHRIPGDKL